MGQTKRIYPNQWKVQHNEAIETGTLSIPIRIMATGEQKTNRTFPDGWRSEGCESCDMWVTCGVSGGWREDYVYLPGGMG